jgi:glycerophosphoryl diester phosphodiesterase
LTVLKKDVDGKNNTVDFVSATANVKAVNHRGYNTIAPENTIPAFKLSRAKGFKYIETDVRFTSDGVPVLLHDATINRTARNADGTTIASTINIADITYEQALTYDFGVWKSLEYAGTKIPTLAELMKLCRDNGLTPRVELNVLTVANAETMFNVINSYGMARKVEYNCNDLTVAEKFLELEPQATIVYGMNSYVEATVNSLAALKTNHNTIIINMLTSGITSAFVEKCKATRIEAETWTVNDMAVIRGLDPYISGVTSDSLNAAMILYQDTL